MKNSKVSVKQIPAKKRGSKVPKDEDYSTPYTPTPPPVALVTAPAAAQQPKPRRHNPGVMPSQEECRRRFDLVQGLVFDNHVPVMSKVDPGKAPPVGKTLLQKMLQMTPGQSFAIEFGMAGIISKAIWECHRAIPGGRYVSRKVDDKTLRIWRVK